MENIDGFTDAQVKKINKKLNKKILAFELEARRRVLVGSHKIATQVVQLVIDSISNSKSDKETAFIIKNITNLLVSHFPTDIIIKNICEKILEKLEEEIPKAGSDSFIARSHSTSLIDILLTTKNTNIQNQTESLWSSMNENLSFIRDELSTTYENIAQNAPNFIFANDIIMTLGYSSSMLSFFTVKRFYNLTVVIPERSPENDGMIMAKKLKNAGVNVYLIPDSAIFAILPKVSKVIVSAHTVFVNGGILSFSLANSVALAAKHYNIPFIALYWRLKMSYEMPKPRKSYTSLNTPQHVFNTTDPNTSNCVVMHPECEYVPPELITLMINQDGAHCPSDVFSLASNNL